MSHVEQWFRFVDKDNSGRISATELQQALAMGNLCFSLTTVAHIIRQHDTSGTGEVNLEDFRRLHQFLISMQSSFVYFDQDRSGTLTPDEIANAILRAGFNLHEHVVKRVILAFDPDRKGYCSLSDFIEMTLFLSSGAAAFAAFDPQGTGKVTLDFNQFLYACAHWR